MSETTTHIEKINTLVPELRFKEFDSEWFKKKFDDAVIIVTGQVDPKEEPYASMPHIGPGNMVSMTGELGEYRTAKQDQQTSGKYLFDEKHVLYGKINPQLGKVVFPQFIGVCSADTYPMEAIKDVLIPPFLKYLLMERRFYKYSVSVSQRTGMPKINRDELSAFTFRLPSLPEQQKIASFLSDVDEKIQQLTRKKELLEDYKKGVMQQIFSQQIRFKDENGNDFPEWEEKKLGDLTKKVGKKNKENIAYPVYSINNKEGFLPQADQFEGLDGTGRGYDISMYKIIHPNTFAYNPARINVGSIGYSYDLDHVIISSLYVCFQTTKELEDSYLLAYLDTFNFNKSVLRNVEGGVRQYLFYENFSHIKMPLPSNEEQLKIAAFLLEIDERIKENEKQLIQTQTFKKGLLQKMFV